MGCLPIGDDVCAELLLLICASDLQSGTARLNNLGAWRFRQLAFSGQRTRSCPSPQPENCMNARSFSALVARSSISPSVWSQRRDGWRQSRRFYGLRSLLRQLGVGRPEPECPFL